MGNERGKIELEVKINYQGQVYEKDQKEFDLDDITREQLDEIVADVFAGVLDDAKAKGVYVMHKPTHAKHYAPGAQLANLIEKYPTAIQAWEAKTGNSLQPTLTMSSRNAAERMVFGLAYYYEIAKQNKTSENQPISPTAVSNISFRNVDQNVSQNAPRYLKRDDIIGDVSIIYNNKEYTKNGEFLNLNTITYDQLKTVIETVFKNDFELLESKRDGYFEVYAQAQPGQQLVSLVRNFPEKIQEWQNETGNHFSHIAEYRQKYNSNVADQITAHNLVFYTQVAKDPESYADIAKDIPLNKVTMEAPTVDVSDARSSEEKPLSDQVTPTKVAEVIEPVMKPIASNTTEAILNSLQSNDDMAVSDKQTIVPEIPSVYDVEKNLTAEQSVQNDLASTLPISEIPQSPVVDNSFVDPIVDTSDTNSEAKLRQQLEALITTRKLDLTIADNLTHWQNQVSWRGLGGGVEVMDSFGNSLKDENNKPYKVPHAVARMNNAIQDWKLGRSETGACINQLAEAVEKANSRYTFFQPNSFNTRKQETQNTYDAVKDLNTQVSMKK